MRLTWCPPTSASNIRGPSAPLSVPYGGNDISRSGMLLSGHCNCLWILEEDRPTTPERSRIFTSIISSVPLHYLRFQSDFPYTLSFPLLPSLLNVVLSLLALLLWSCRGDLDLSRLNLVKTLGLWRGLRERLCLLGDIVLDLEYVDSCALVLFLRASPKSNRAFTSSNFSFFLRSYSYLSAMIGSSFS
ncbi:hypothetical protein Tco_0505250 [Tanacetum coccineum]